MHLRWVLVPHRCPHPVELNTSQAIYLQKNSREMLENTNLPNRSLFIGSGKRKQVEEGEKQPYKEGKPKRRKTMRCLNTALA
jgi:hypothetical protein